MDYGKTLNLLQTDFPMRGNLPQKEPGQLQTWYDEKLNERRRELRQGKEKFVLHDGPPYANGHLHLGHALNKIIKDIIVKYKYMRGFDAPYVPGWDTHGMPIEHAAIKILGLNRHELDILELRRECHQYALKYVDIQREEFKRLGVIGDWSNPYITLQKEYEGIQIRVFGDMANNGHIYKGLKTVYWCPHCETALAEAEVEYAEKKSNSIFVKFPLVDGKGKIAELPNLPTFAVIWTTTPWTIPANQAISANADFTYVWVKAGEEIFLMAKDLMGQVAGEVKAEGWEILAEQPGLELEGVEFAHPYEERVSPILLGEHVTLEAGTGLVHTSPAHGQEDFDVCKKYDITILSIVDHTGHFTKDAGIVAGQFIDDGGITVIKELAGRGRLLSKSSMRHQYPHCWRCKNPIIYRATEQWFASVENFRQDALNAIDNEVKWIPAWGRNRIYNMVEARQEWCISRQRVWGMPIPVFYCDECNEPIINDVTINGVSTRFTAEGADSWWKYDAKEFLPADFACPHCASTKGYRKETDTMDVWFDSGSSHAAVLRTRPELHWPADMYLEGSDQHRGWFQSSLLTSVATTGHAPYKSVLTHGFIVDGEGKKMSKSVGNVIVPQEVIEKYGADVLRLWVSSTDYQSDIRISPEILKQVSENYRKIRNTLRYLVGNLYDFDPSTDRVAYSDLMEIDQWLLMRLQKVEEKVTESFEEYEFHQMFHAVHNFCTVDLSAIYLDIIKDRTYASGAESLLRRSAQTVLFDTTQVLLRLIAPVLSFTADEVWSYLPVKEELESIHLTDWPKVDVAYKNEELENKWERLLLFRGEVLKALEIARQKKEIGNSVDAGVDVYVDSDWQEVLGKSGLALDQLAIVSELKVYPLENAPADVFASEEISMKVDVRKPNGQKCDRCWLTTTDGVAENDSYLCARCAEVLQGI